MIGGLIGGQKYNNALIEVRVIRCLIGALSSFSRCVIPPLDNQNSDRVCHFSPEYFPSVSHFFGTFCRLNRDVNLDFYRVFYDTKEQKREKEKEDDDSVFDATTP